MKSPLEIQRYIDLLSQHSTLTQCEPLIQMNIFQIIHLSGVLSATIVLRWSLSDTPNPADPESLYLALEDLCLQARAFPTDDPPLSWLHTLTKQDDAAPCG